MTWWSCAPPASRPSRPASWWRRSWTGSGCGCIPRRPGSRTSPEAPRASTFLGFEHRMRESWKQPGRWYLHKWPSRRAMASIRGKIRDRTDRRYARLPLEWAVENLNPVLRGWGNYFRYGNSAAEVRPDRRLRQRTPRDPGQRQARTPRPQLGHPLQLRVGQPARRLSPQRNGATNACVCQPVNDVGEPCAGEPHARFDAAAGGNPGQSASAARPADASRRPYDAVVSDDLYVAPAVDEPRSCRRTASRRSVCPDGSRRQRTDPRRFPRSRKATAAVPPT